MTIEHRAEALINQFDSLISHKFPKVHLITHSFGGADARYALSQMALNERVHSLTTLCTPHHGCALINQATKYPKVFGNLATSEKAIEAVGLSLKNVQEFTGKNMAAFNEIVEDCSDVGYYSFGASQKEGRLGELLKQNYQTISEHQIEKMQMDGLSFLDE